jgi:hypothetical protein
VVGAVWGAIGKTLAERWIALAAPAVVFWTGAMLVWIFSGPGWSRSAEATTWLSSQSTVAQLAIMLGALVVVAASTIVVRRLTTPVLRLLEGYWPAWMDWLADRRRGKAAADKDGDDESWQVLMQELGPQHPREQEERGRPTAKQLSEISQLEHRRRHRPVLVGELLPTRIGNILRAAETRPGHRYGLNAVVVWPRLWLVLPESARQELADARTALDGSVAAGIWGAAFVAFTPWAWWAAPVGAVVAAAAVAWWVPARAEVFADLVEATFDLYRSELYRQLRWPLPVTPAEEHESGSELTQYLVRGSNRPHPEFTPPA